MTYEEFRKEVVQKTRNRSRGMLFISFDRYSAKAREILSDEEKIFQVYDKWIVEYCGNVKEQFVSCQDNDKKIGKLIDHTSAILYKVITIESHHKELL